ncbi:MAG: helix-turn-helix domain-containing protein [Deinococcales bacterium]
MRTYRTHREALIERFRNDPEEMNAYLEVSFEEFQEDNDLPVLLLALRTIAESQGGISLLAQRLDIPRQTIHQALSDDGNPQFSTLNKILKGLGYRLSVGLL